MEKCIRLYREEMALREMRDAESAYDLSRVYSKRQERLELMASRVVTVEACGSLGSGVMLDTAHVPNRVVATSSGVCPQNYCHHRRRVGTRWRQGIASRISSSAGGRGAQFLGRRNSAGSSGQDVFAVGHPGAQSYCDQKHYFVCPAHNRRPPLCADRRIHRPGNSGAASSTNWAPGGTAYL